jgi:hypothetical protein
MPDRNLGIESCQRAAKCGGSITLDQGDIRSLIGEDSFKSTDDPRRGLIKTLPWTHDVQIAVGLNLEHIQNLVQHFTVLTGNAYTHVEVVGTALHVTNNWA